MTTHQPPQIATWLLQHFGSGADNETLLGDLAEQYLQKRSALWYWRQVIKAIPVSLFKQIRGQKWIAARALLTGWVMWVLCAALFFPFVFFGTNAGYYFEPSAPIASAWSFLWMPVLGLANLQRQPVYLVIAAVVPLIVGVISGWLVARWQVCTRTHPPAIQISRVRRDQKTGVVLLFAGSMLLIDLLLLGPFIVQLGPATAYTFSGRLAAHVAASVVGIVVGGGLLRDHSRTAQE